MSMKDIHAFLLSSFLPSLLLSYFPSFLSILPYLSKFFKLLKIFGQVCFILWTLTGVEEDMLFLCLVSRKDAEEILWAKERDGSGQWSGAYSLTDFSW